MIDEAYGEGLLIMKKRRLIRSIACEVNGGQGYFPSDIRKYYNIPDNLDGSGQTIGILEFSNGYSLSDAELFWQMHHISPPNVEFVSVDGTRNDGGASSEDEEASLDLQWAGAIAPGAHIVIYEASAGQTDADFAASMQNALQYILQDTAHSPTVLSISYGDGEISFGSQAIETWEKAIAQLDAQGITVCVASGDDGAYGLHNLNGPLTRHADAPASCPHAVAVGGTSLPEGGSESAWTYYGPQNGGATGGGYSQVFSMPVFQTKAGLSGQGRALPDIAFNADPATGYQIIFQGQPIVVGGTSVATPIFAAIVALVNQKRSQIGLSPVSGLTEILYQQSQSLPYNSITSGNNSFNGVVGYNAGPGWNACTGFGSLNVASFIESLLR